MSETMENKRAATTTVKSLGLPPHLRARALILAAADSLVGNILRILIQLNEDDVEVKHWVKSS